MTQAFAHLYGGTNLLKMAALNLSSGRIYRGCEVEELENFLSELLDMPYIIATPQARVALYLLVKHTVGPGKDIITSPLTICDAVNMILCAGCDPKFVDVKYETCNLDPEMVRSAIDDRTGAVIATHLNGMVSDMRELKIICEQHGVPLIEDAAQAFGALAGDGQHEIVGQSAAFSFGLKKNVNTLFGGIVATRQQKLADAIQGELANWPYEDRARFIKRLVTFCALNLATSDTIFNLLTGPAMRIDSSWAKKISNILDVHLNQNIYSREDMPDRFRRRFTPMQARMALSQMAQVNADTERRQSLASIYRRDLSNMPGITIPGEMENCHSIYTSFPILVDCRPKLMDYMKREGRSVTPYYYHNLADEACYSDFARDCPVARKVSESMVMLPIYPSYTDEEAQRNVDVVRKYFSHAV